MKKIVTFLAILFSTFLSAQTGGKCTYTVKLLNNKLQPMPNTPISLIETTSKERIAKSTNAQGIVVFELTTGERWAVNVLKMKNCKFLDIDLRRTGTASATLTYDYEFYERKNRPLVDRSNLKFEKVDQTLQKNTRVNTQLSLVKIHLFHVDESGVSNFPVNLTCYKLGKTFLGKTNKVGDAYFQVPAQNEYEIDIDGVESMHFIDLKGNGEYESEFLFEPSNIIEKDLNDTVVQTLAKDTKASSSRALVKLKISKFSQSGIVNLANDDIYLQMLKTNKVYKAKTNSAGYAYFLLPLERKYMVHFRYEKDVDIVNCSDVEGIANIEGSFIYHPDPKLEFPERYIPNPQELVLKDFLEFVTKTFPDPKDGNIMGLHLSWGNPEINNTSKEAILQIGFNAKTPKVKTSAPFNIALVVDKSGSMAGNDRIDALKIALLSFVDKLRPTDIVSLVVFDDKSTVLVPSQQVGDKSFLRDMIEDIQAGGGTDIFVGMVDGYEQVLKKLIPGGTNRVILLTDGYGSTPVEVIVDKSKEYNKKGIQISTVGVGSGYNQSMLTLLSTAGGGLLHFAGESKNFAEVFEKELNSILTPCAKNVKIEVLYNDKIVFNQLYGHEISSKTTNKVEINLDNIYSGLNTLSLIKFDLNMSNSSIEKQPVIVRIRYLDPTSKKEVVIEEKAYLKWSESTGQLELILEAQHKKLYAIAILNQSIKAMTEAFVKQDFKGALAATKSTTDQIKKLYPQSNDLDVKKLVDQIEFYSKGIASVVSKSKT